MRASLLATTLRPPDITMIASSSLTPRQVRDFHLDGYLRLEQFLTSTELRIMRQVYDEWILTQKADSSISFVELAADVPELRVCQFRERALEIVRTLIGDEAKQGAEKFMYRPPEHEVPTPWHQDWAFGSPNHVGFRINFWIPLQETGTDGGCLWYLPGSHQQDILPHRNRADITPGHQKDVDMEATPGLFDEEQAVPMILPAGGAAIHLGNTLHMARPNCSGEPRRAYVLSFGGRMFARWMQKPFERWPWMEERREVAGAKGEKASKTN